jgi:SAM-dependent methyltransferase
MSTTRLSDVADEIVNAALDALQANDLGRAKALLDAALGPFPHDPRLRVMSAIVARAEGQPGVAMDHLWRGLAADPAHAMCRTEMGFTVLTDAPAQGRPDKDFSLDSGERQTAREVAQIRADHRARYAFAARWLLQHQARPSHCVGLDAFCGNGYGSRIVADQCGARMVGIDGSSDAVSLAEECFGSHRVVFAPAVFPFQLQANLFDFSICFESIEHVDDPETMLQELAGACRGPIILSVPNEQGLPFARYGHRFEHHVRHFTLEEIQAMLLRAGRPHIVDVRGQDVYTTSEDDLTGLLPEDRMMLTAARSDSQFLILVAQPG